MKYAESGRAFFCFRTLVAGTGANSRILSSGSPSLHPSPEEVKVDCGLY